MKKMVQRRENKEVRERRKVGQEKVFSVVPSLPLHPTRGNEEQRANKTCDMYTGKDMMRCLWVCMEAPLSRN